MFNKLPVGKRRKFWQQPEFHDFADRLRSTRIGRLAEVGQRRVMPTAPPPRAPAPAAPPTTESWVNIPSRRWSGEGLEQRRQALGRAAAPPLTNENATYRQTIQRIQELDSLISAASNGPDVLSEQRLQDLMIERNQVRSWFDTPRADERAPGFLGQFARWSNRFFIGRPPDYAEAMIQPPTLEEQQRAAESGEPLDVAQGVAVYVPPAERTLAAKIGRVFSSLYGGVRLLHEGAEQNIPGYDLAFRGVSTAWTSTRLGWSLIANTPQAIWSAINTGSQPLPTRRWAAWEDDKDVETKLFGLHESFGHRLLESFTILLQPDLEAMDAQIEGLQGAWDAMQEDVIEGEPTPAQLALMQTGLMPGTTQFALSPEQTYELQTLTQQVIERDEQIQTDWHGALDTYISRYEYINSEQALMDLVSRGLTVEQASEQLVADVATLRQAGTEHMLAFMRGETHELTGTWQYSWNMASDGPERQRLAAEALFAASLQRGELPPLWMRQEITARYSDPGVEFAGDTVFDPLWVIPAAWMDKVVVGPIRWLTRLPGRAARAIAPGFYRQFTEFVATQSIRAQAHMLVNRLSIPLSAVAYNTDTTAQFVEILGRAVRGDLPLEEARTYGLFANHLIQLRGDETLMRALGLTERELAGRVIGQAENRAVAEAIRRRATSGLSEEVLRQEAIEAVSRQPIALVDHMLRTIRENFINTRRVFGPRGQLLSDDLLAYLLRKDPTMRRMMAEVAAEFPAETADQLFIRASRELYGDANARIFGMAARSYEFVFRAYNTLRSAWFNLVLTARPAWNVWNYLDTGFRAVIHGVNPFDDLAARMAANPPPQSIRGGFYNMYIGGRAVSDYLRTGDGIVDIARMAWNQEQRVISKPMAFLHAFASSLEQAWRTRLYYTFLDQERAVAIRLVQQEVSHRVLAESDDLVRRIARDLVAQGGGDATRTAQLFNQAAVRGPEQGRAVIGLVWPAEVTEDLSRVLGIGPANEFIQNVGREVQHLVDAGELSPENIRRLFNQIRAEIAPHINQALERAHATDAVSGAFRPRAGDVDAGLESVVDDAMAGVELEGQIPPTIVGEEAAGLVPEEVVPTPVVEIPPDIPAGAPAEAYRRTMEEVQQNASLVERVARSDTSHKRRATIREGMETLAAEGQALARATAQVAAFGDEVRREGAELLTALQAATTAGDLGQVQAITEQVTRNIRTAEYVSQVVSDMQAIVSGPLRTFLLDDWPGPLRLFGGPRVAAWRQRTDIVTRLYRAASASHLELIEVVRANPDELVRRALAGETISPLALLEQAGWTFQWDGDRLVSFQVFRNPITNPHWITQLQTRLGRIGKTELDRPFTRLATAVEAATPPAAAVEAAGEGMADVVTTVRTAVSRTEQVQTEGWQTIINTRRMGPEDTATRASTVQNLFGRSHLPDGRLALDSFDNFVEFLDDRIARMMRAKPSPARDRRLSFYRWLRDDVNRDWAAYLAFQGLAPSVVPAVPRLVSMPYGFRNAIAGAADAVALEEALSNNLHNWEQWLNERVGVGDWPLQSLADEQRALLARMGGDVSDLLHGAEEVTRDGGDFLGRRFDGAVPRVNETMIDYYDTMRFDEWMKGFYPFWMFPSRSVPFWIKTMALHPEIAAFYFRYIESGRRLAVQRGATTSYGEPLPSLYGYLPIPHTDIWVDFSRPFSFRQVFPSPSLVYADDMYYGSAGEVIGSWLYRISTMYGFSPSPIYSSLLFRSGTLSRENFTPFSLVPQLPLIAPFAERILLHRLRQTQNPHLPDTWNPHVSFEDYLIENRILQIVAEQLADPSLSHDQQVGLVTMARRAINWDNRTAYPEALELWRRARDEVEMQDWGRDLLAYFTGITGQSFTDAEAEMLRMRNENNNLRYSMNELLGVEMFDYYPDAQQLWDFYLDRRYRSVRGQMAGLRSVVSWTRVPQALPILNTRDRLSDEEAAAWLQEARATSDHLRQTQNEERDWLISLRLDEEARTEAYSQARENAYAEYHATMNRFPVGYRGPETDSAWSHLMEQLASIETQPEYDSAHRGWTIGYKPEELVYEQFRNLLFYSILGTMPEYNPETMTYGQWLEQKAVWADNLGNLPWPTMLQIWHETFGNVQWLAPELNRPANLEQRLRAELTPEGFRQWELDNDDVYGALERVWVEFYYRPYFDATRDLAGDRREVAERRFFSQFGSEGRPSNAQFAQWIQQLYGNRFSNSEIMEAIGGRGASHVEDRLTSRDTELGQQEDRVWELLGWLDPGQQRTDFTDALVAIGGADAEDWLTTFYNAGADGWRNPEEFARFTQMVEQAAHQIGLQAPTGPELQDRIRVRDLNDQLRRSIEQTLGADIWRLRDVYGRMSRAERAVYRTEHPTEYARIQQSYDMYDSFALRHPNWARYYRPKTSKFDDGGGAVGGGYTSRRRAAAQQAAQIVSGYVPMGIRSTMDVRELLAPGAVGRHRPTGRLVWPPTVQRLVSAEALDEVEQASVSGQPLDEKTSKYLAKLYKRHPDLRTLIEQVLAR